MSSKKKKYWKIILVSICVTGLIVAWLGFGEQGLFQLYKREKERRALAEKIRTLAEENRALLDEIERLRTDMKYVESVIRKELSLIRENEVIYRFKDDLEKEGSDGS